MVFIFSTKKSYDKVMSVSKGKIMKVYVFLIFSMNAFCVYSSQIPSDQPNQINGPYPPDSNTYVRCLNPHTTELQRMFNEKDQALSSKQIVSPQEPIFNNITNNSDQ